MLVLTRRIGEAIRIGDDVRLTVQARLRHHITLGVTAPGLTELLVEDATVTPRVLSGGRRFYLVPLLTGESVRIGEIEIRVCFDTAWASGRQVRLAIAAPRSVPVHREEVY
ncbi:MAG: carbon storage regulator, partial [Lysobacteraceae bacterium]